MTNLFLETTYFTIKCKIPKKVKNYLVIWTDGPMDRRTGAFFGPQQLQNLNFITFQQNRATFHLYSVYLSES